jgi:hypothetical protein
MSQVIYIDLLYALRQYTLCDSIYIKSGGPTENWFFSHILHLFSLSERVRESGKDLFLSLPTYRKKNIKLKSMVSYYLLTVLYPNNPPMKDTVGRMKMYNRSLYWVDLLD